jgi:hypothetical protein
MPFPNTRQALEANGYSFIENLICKCGAKIERWKTPRERTMPLQFTETDTNHEICQPHFSCEYAADYSERLRRAKEKAAATSADAPMSPDAA